MVEDGFRTGEQHIVEAGYLRHSRARPDIPSFLRRLADPVRHDFEKILEAGGQHGLFVERGGRHQITGAASCIWRRSSIRPFRNRSEEHTYGLQPLMRTPHAALLLNKKKQTQTIRTINNHNKLYTTQ